MPVSAYRLSPNEVDRLYKEEVERRRKQRIVQVREIAKRNAAKMRESVQKEKQRQLQKLADKIGAEWEQQKEEELRKLQEIYDASLKTVGESHKAAEDFDPRYEEQVILMLEDQKRAEERHSAAMRKVRRDREKKDAKENMHVFHRHAALEKERIRSAKMASLPAPPPDPVRALKEPEYKPVRVYDASSFSHSLYHLPDFGVERAEDIGQQNAKQAAADEEVRVQELKDLEKRARQETLEKARLRHKHARNKELLKRDYDQLLLDLSDLQRADKTRRSQIVHNIPKSIFNPPHRRMDEKTEQQKTMEEAFENMYLAATDYCGDITLALDPSQAPRPPNPAVDLDVTPIPSDDDGDVTPTHDADTMAPKSQPLREVTNVVAASPKTSDESAKEGALKKLMTRIHRQRKDWEMTNQSELTPMRDEPSNEKVVPKRGAPSDEKTMASEEPSASTETLSGEHSITDAAPSDNGAPLSVYTISSSDNSSSRAISETLEQVIAGNEPLLHPLEKAGRVRQKARNQEEEQRQASERLAKAREEQESLERHTRDLETKLNELKARKRLIEEHDARNKIHQQQLYKQHPQTPPSNHDPMEEQRTMSTRHQPTRPQHIMADLNESETNEPSYRPPQMLPSAAIGTASSAPGFTHDRLLADARRTPRGVQPQAGRSFPGTAAQNYPEVPQPEQLVSGNYVTGDHDDRLYDTDYSRRERARSSPMHDYSNRVEIPVLRQSPKKTSESWQNDRSHYSPKPSMPLGASNRQSHPTDIDESSSPTALSMHSISGSRTPGQSSMQESSTGLSMHGESLRSRTMERYNENDIDNLVKKYQIEASRDTQPQNVSPQERRTEHAADRLSQQPAFRHISRADASMSPEERRDVLQSLHSALRFRHPQESGGQENGSQGSPGVGLGRVTPASDYRLPELNTDLNNRRYTNPAREDKGNREQFSMPSASDQYMGDSGYRVAPVQSNTDFDLRRTPMAADVGSKADDGYSQKEREGVTRSMQGVTHSMQGATHSMQGAESFNELQEELRRQMAQSRFQGLRPDSEDDAGNSQRQTTDDFSRSIASPNDYAESNSRFSVPRYSHADSFVSPDDRGRVSRSPGGFNQHQDELRHERAGMQFNRLIPDAEEDNIRKPEKDDSFGRNHLLLRDHLAALPYSPGVESPQPAEHASYHDLSLPEHKPQPAGHASYHDLAMLEYIPLPSETLATSSSSNLGLRQSIGVSNAEEDMPTLLSSPQFTPASPDLQALAQRQQEFDTRRQELQAQLDEVRRQKESLLQHQRALHGSVGTQSKRPPVARHMVAVDDHVPHELSLIPEVDTPRSSHPPSRAGNYNDSYLSTYSYDQSQSLSHHPITDLSGPSSPRSSTTQNEPSELSHYPLPDQSGLSLSSQPISTSMSMPGPSQMNYNPPVYGSHSESSAPVFSALIPSPAGSQLSSPGMTSTPGKFFRRLEATDYGNKNMSNNRRDNDSLDMMDYPNSNNTLQLELKQWHASNTRTTPQEVNSTDNGTRVIPASDYQSPTDIARKMQSPMKNNSSDSWSKLSTSGRYDRSAAFWRKHSLVKMKQYASGFVQTDVVDRVDRGCNSHDLVDDDQQTSGKTSGMPGLQALENAGVQTNGSDVREQMWSPQSDLQGTVSQRAPPQNMGDFSSKNMSSFEAQQFSRNMAFPRYDEEFRTVQSGYTGPVLGQEQGPAFGVSGGHFVKSAHTVSTAGVQEGHPQAQHDQSQSQGGRKHYLDSSNVSDVLKQLQGGNIQSQQPHRSRHGQAPFRPHTATGTPAQTVYSTDFRRDFPPQQVTAPDMKQLFETEDSELVKYMQRDQGTHFLKDRKRPSKEYIRDFIDSTGVSDGMTMMNEGQARDIRQGLPVSKDFTHTSSRPRGIDSMGQTMHGMPGVAWEVPNQQYRNEFQQFAQEAKANFQQHATASQDREGIKSPGVPQSTHTKQLTKAQEALLTIHNAQRAGVTLGGTIEQSEMPRPIPIKGLTTAQEALQTIHNAQKTDTTWGASGQGQMPRSTIPSPFKLQEGLLNVQDSQRTDRTLGSATDQRQVVPSISQKSFTKAQDALRTLHNAQRTGGTWVGTTEQSQVPQSVSPTGFTKPSLASHTMPDAQKSEKAGGSTQQDHQPPQSASRTGLTKAQEALRTIHNSQRSDVIWGGAQQQQQRQIQSASRTGVTEPQEALRTIQHTQQVEKVQGWSKEQQQIPQSSSRTGLTKAQEALRTIHNSQRSDVIWGGAQQQQRQIPQSASRTGVPEPKEAFGTIHHTQQSEKVQGGATEQWKLPQSSSRTGLTKAQDALRTIHNSQRSDVIWGGAQQQERQIPQSGSRTGVTEPQEALRTIHHTQQVEKVQGGTKEQRQIPQSTSRTGLTKAQDAMRAIHSPQRSDVIWGGAQQQQRQIPQSASRTGVTEPKEALRTIHHTQQAGKMQGGGTEQQKLPQSSSRTGLTKAQDALRTIHNSQRSDVIWGGAQQQERQIPQSSRTGVTEPQEALRTIQHTQQAGKVQGWGTEQQKLPQYASRTGLTKAQDAVRAIHSPQRSDVIWGGTQQQQRQLPQSASRTGVTEPQEALRTIQHTQQVEKVQGGSKEQRQIPQSTSRTGLTKAQEALRTIHNSQRSDVIWGGAQQQQQRQIPQSASRTGVTEPKEAFGTIHHTQQVEKVQGGAKEQWQLPQFASRTELAKAQDAMRTIHNSQRSDGGAQQKQHQIPQSASKTGVTEPQEALRTIHHTQQAGKMQGGGKEQRQIPQSASRTGLTKAQEALRTIHTSERSDVIWGGATEPGQGSRPKSQKSATAAHKALRTIHDAQKPTRTQGGATEQNKNFASRTGLTKAQGPLRTMHNAQRTDKTEPSQFPQSSPLRGAIRAQDTAHAMTAAQKADNTKGPVAEPLAPPSTFRSGITEMQAALQTIQTGQRTWVGVDGIHPPPALSGGPPIKEAGIRSAFVGVSGKSPIPPLLSNEPRTYSKTRVVVENSPVPSSNVNKQLTGAQAALQNIRDSRRKDPPLVGDRERAVPPGNVSKTSLVGLTKGLQALRSNPKLAVMQKDVLRSGDVFKPIGGAQCPLSVGRETGPPRNEMEQPYEMKNMFSKISGRQPGADEAVGTKSSVKNLKRSPQPSLESLASIPAAKRVAKQWVKKTNSKKQSVADNIKVPADHFRQAFIAKTVLKTLPDGQRGIFVKGERTEPKSGTDVQLSMSKVTDHKTRAIFKNIMAAHESVASLDVKTSAIEVEKPSAAVMKTIQNDQSKTIELQPPSNSTRKESLGKASPMQGGYARSNNSNETSRESCRRSRESSHRTKERNAYKAVQKTSSVEADRCRHELKNSKTDLRWRGMTEEERMLSKGSKNRFVGLKKNQVSVDKRQTSAEETNCPRERNGSSCGRKHRQGVASCPKDDMRTVHQSFKNVKDCTFLNKTDKLGSSEEHSKSEDFRPISEDCTPRLEGLNVGSVSGDGRVLNMPNLTCCGKNGNAICTQKNNIEFCSTGAPLLKTGNEERRIGQICYENSGIVEPENRVAQYDRAVTTENLRQVQTSLFHREKREAYSSKIKDGSGRGIPTVDPKKPASQLNGDKNMNKYLASLMKTEKYQAWAEGCQGLTDKNIQLEKHLTFCRQTQQHSQFYETSVNGSALNSQISFSTGEDDSRGVKSSSDHRSSASEELRLIYVGGELFDQSGVPLKATAMQRIRKTLDSKLPEQKKTKPMATTSRGNKSRNENAESRNSFDDEELIRLNKENVNESDTTPLYKHRYSVEPKPEQSHSELKLRTEGSTQSTPIYARDDSDPQPNIRTKTQQWINSLRSSEESISQRPKRLSFALSNKASLENVQNPRAREFLLAPPVVVKTSKNKLIANVSSFNPIYESAESSVPLSNNNDRIQGNKKGLLGANEQGKTPYWAQMPNNESILNPSLFSTPVSAYIGDSGYKSALSSYIEATQMNDSLYNTWLNKQLGEFESAFDEPFYKRTPVPGTCCQAAAPQMKKDAYCQPQFKKQGNERGPSIEENSARKSPAPGSCYRTFDTNYNTMSSYENTYAPKKRKIHGDEQLYDSPQSVKFTGKLQTVVPAFDLRTNEGRTKCKHSVLAKNNTCDRQMMMPIVDAEPMLHGFPPKKEQSVPWSKRLLSPKKSKTAADYKPSPTFSSMMKKKPPVRYISPREKREKRNNQKLVCRSDEHSQGSKSGLCEVCPLQRNISPFPDCFYSSVKELVKEHSPTPVAQPPNNPASSPLKGSALKPTKTSLKQTVECPVTYFAQNPTVTQPCPFNPSLACPAASMGLTTPKAKPTWTRPEASSAQHTQPCPFNPSLACPGASLGINRPLKTQPRQPCSFNVSFECTEPSFVKTSLAQPLMSTAVRPQRCPFNPSLACPGASMGMSQPLYTQPAISSMRQVQPCLLKSSLASPIANQYGTSYIKPKQRVVLNSSLTSNPEYCTAITQPTQIEAQRRNDARPRSPKPPSEILESTRARNSEQKTESVTSGPHKHPESVDSIGAYSAVVQPTTTQPDMYSRRQTQPPSFKPSSPLETQQQTSTTKPCAAPPYLRSPSPYTPQQQMKKRTTFLDTNMTYPYSYQPNIECPPCYTMQVNPSPKLSPVKHPIAQPCPLKPNLECPTPYTMVARPSPEEPKSSVCKQQIVRPCPFTPNLVCPTTPSMLAKQLPEEPKPTSVKHRIARPCRQQAPANSPLPTIGGKQPTVCVRQQALACQQLSSSARSRKPVFQPFCKRFLRRPCPSTIVEQDEDSIYIESYEGSPVFSPDGALLNIARACRDASRVKKSSRFDPFLTVPSRESDYKQSSGSSTHSHAASINPTSSQDVHEYPLETDASNEMEDVALRPIMTDETDYDDFEPTRVCLAAIQDLPGPTYEKLDVPDRDTSVKIISDFYQVLDDNLLLPAEDGISEGKGVRKPGEKRRSSMPEPPKSLLTSFFAGIEMNQVDDTEHTARVPFHPRNTSAPFDFHNILSKATQFSTMNLQRNDNARFVDDYTIETDGGSNDPADIYRRFMDPLTKYVDYPPDRPQHVWTAQSQSTEQHPINNKMDRFLTNPMDLGERSLATAAAPFPDSRFSDKPISSPDLCPSRDYDDMSGKNNNGASPVKSNKNRTIKIRILSPGDSPRCRNADRRDGKSPRQTWQVTTNQGQSWENSPKNGENETTPTIVIRSKQARTQQWSSDGPQPFVHSRTQSPNKQNDSLASFEQHELSVAASENETNMEGAGAGASGFSWLLPVKNEGEITLQEALMKKNPKFLQLAEQRRHQLNDPEHKRELYEQVKAKTAGHLTNTMSSWLKARAVRPKSGGKWSSPKPVSLEVRTSEDRKKKTQQTAARNKRLYNQLEEVKKLKQEQDKKEMQALNRQRKREFEMKLQAARRNKPKGGT